MEEYRSRMLASPKSKRVLDTIFAAALDDEHKGPDCGMEASYGSCSTCLLDLEKQIVQNGGRKLYR